MRNEQTDFFEVRDRRVERLRERIQRGDYNLPGETIAECLQTLPVGELTPEQIALVTEPIVRRNKAASRRLAAEAGQGWCNVHQCAYKVVHGHRTLDCDQYFGEQVSEAVQKLKRMQDAERTFVRQDRGVVAEPGDRSVVRILPQSAERARERFSFQEWLAISLFALIVTGAIWALTTTGGR